MQDLVAAFPNFHSGLFWRLVVLETLLCHLLYQCVIVLFLQLSFDPVTLQLACLVLEADRFMDTQQISW